MSIDICKELSQNFIDFSYEANSERAFPDVRDGMKPGQRACLWVMYNKGFSSNKPHVKSAKIDGSVAAEIWPHGTTAVYETFARMSQDWINNIPEVDWHGANGNVVISDKPAADRYCVTGDTLIKTNIGTVPIKELIEDGVYEKELNNIQVVDYKGNFVPATKIFNSGTHKIKQITLNNGQVIKGTYNHPLVVLNKNDVSFSWKTLEELTENDKIIIPLFNYSQDCSNVDINSGDIEYKMLGSMTSEGYITTQNRIGINNTDINLIKPVQEYFNSLGLSTANINYNEKRKYYEYCLSNKEYYNIFINKYNYKTSAKNKTIPDIVFKASLENKSAFLRYLFEGDGSVSCAKTEHNKKIYNVGQVSYSSYSKKLIEQVQILLIQDFSIFSTIKSTKRKTGIEYKLYITGRGLKNFRQKINFLSDRKRDLLKKACDIYDLKDKIANGSYYSTTEISEYVRKINKNKYTEKHNFGNIKNFYLCKDYIDTYNYQRLNNYVNNYVAVKIKKIDDLPEEFVYSVRVDNEDSEHSFVANGFINHNTEARLSKAAEDGMLCGLNKQVVPMQLNFSEDQEWPTVLPAVFPRLIINGSQGIGVTIAQTWIPHNLNEISDLIIKYIKDNTIDCSSIYPDFPSGGVIINKNDLHEIYETGKGKIILRGKVSIEDNNIIITELPYQVYVEPFINEIKDLIEKEIISGIDEIYNKTDDKGLRIEIICSKSATKIVKQLYKNTSLQKTISANHMALLGKTPKMFTLKEYFDEYIKHNLSCITNEYKYDLTNDEKRFEIVCGLVKALSKIDEVIATIKSSKSSADSIKELISNFGFSENQAKAIVDMKLGRLAHLELKELEDENAKLDNEIKNIKSILESEENIKSILIGRLNAFTKKYGFKRKTEVIQYIPEEEAEESAETTEPEKCVVIMTKSGYIKRISGESFKPSKKGSKSIKTQDDITSDVIRTNVVDNLLVFTNKGKLYRLPVKDIPDATTSAKGTPVNILVSMDSDERAETIYSIYKDTDAEFIIYITKNGVIKKTRLGEYVSMKRAKGATAINLKDNDSIASMFLIKDETIVIITKLGKLLWCDSASINPIGKSGSGVNGMKVDSGDEIVSAIPVRDSRDKLGVFTTTGYCKRIDMSEFAIHHRGGAGQMAHKLTKSSGNIADIQMLSNNDLILLVGNKTSICIEGKDIPETKKLSLGDKLLEDIVKVSKV